MANFLKRDDFKFSFDGIGQSHLFDANDVFSDVVNKLHDIVSFINLNSDGMYSCNGKHSSKAYIKIECNDVYIVIDEFSFVFAEILCDKINMYEKFGVIRSSHFNKGKIIIEMFFVGYLRGEEIIEPIYSCVFNGYGEYLKSSHWKKVRQNKLHDSFYACQLCGSEKYELHVHHNNYRNIGNEKENDLVVLCKYCHGKFHDK